MGRASFSGSLGVIYSLILVCDVQNTMLTKYDTACQPGSHCMSCFSNGHIKIDVHVIYDLTSY
jgi:hypothetical protein